MPADRDREAEYRGWVLGRVDLARRLLSLAREWPRHVPTRLVTGFVDSVLGDVELEQALDLADFKKAKSDGDHGSDAYVDAADGTP
jgi:hypothetical protein